jgi:hypothetical protein
MIRFVAVWSLKRGVIDPPEVLDEADQWRATESAAAADAVDRVTLQRRATRGYTVERDQLLLREEEARLRKPVVSARQEGWDEVGRMLDLSKRSA